MKLYPHSTSWLSVVTAVFFLVLAPMRSDAAAYSWTSGTTGGSWSGTGNWSPTGAPGSADTATLGDVTSGTRVVTYDSSAAGSLTTIVFTQTDAGATNELAEQLNLTVTNNFALGATAGTSLLYINPQTTTPLTLKVGATGNGTLTVSSGGNLDMGTSGIGGTAGSAGGSFLSSFLTVTGGVVNVERGTDGTGTVSSFINKGVTMSGGTLTIGSTPLGPTGTASNDNRLQINGVFSSSGGGAIAIGTGLTAGQATITLNGAGANDFSGLSSFNSSINTILLANTSQSLSLGANSLGSLALRGVPASTTTDVKTISATTGTVSSIFFLNGNTTSDGIIELLLGSNLSVTAATNALTASNGSSAINQYIVDTGDTTGYALDLTGMSAGFTPNSPNNTTYWTLNGNGSIKATSFNLNTTGTKLTVAGNVTLNATGGNSTANILTGQTGSSIASTSTFQYTGSAAAATPATLVSNQSLGNLTVQNGALQIANGTSALPPLVVTGGVTVNTGGTLDLTKLPASGAVLSLTSGSENFTVNTGTLALNLGTSSTQIQGVSSDTFSLTNLTLTINQGSGFTTSSSYQLFSGFGTSVADSGIALSNLAGFTATIDGTGLLTFQAVPEPQSWLLALGGLAILVCLPKRRRANG